MGCPCLLVDKCLPFAYMFIYAFIISLPTHNPFIYDCISPCLHHLSKIPSIHLLILLPRLAMGRDNQPMHLPSIQDPFICPSSSPTYPPTFPSPIYPYWLGGEITNTVVFITFLLSIQYTVTKATYKRKHMDQRVRAHNLHGREQDSRQAGRHGSGAVVEKPTG